MVALADSLLDCLSQLGERSKDWKSSLVTGRCLGRYGRMETADRLSKKGFEVFAPRHKSVKVQDRGEKINSLVAKEKELIEGSHPSHGDDAVTVSVVL